MWRLRKRRSLFVCLVALLVLLASVSGEISSSSEADSSSSLKNEEAAGKAEAQETVPSTANNAEDVNASKGSAETSTAAASSSSSGLSNEGGVDEPPTEKSDSSSAEESTSSASDPKESDNEEHAASSEQIITEEEPKNLFRQDLCDRYQQTLNGTLSTEQALKGLKLNTLFQQGLYLQLLHKEEEENDNVDNKQIFTNTSFLVRVMDELATRAGFSWRDSYTVIQGTPTTTSSSSSSNTWTKQLFAGIDMADLYVGSWAHNRVRQKKGVAFTTPLFDDSIVLIGKIPYNKTSTANQRKRRNRIKRFASHISNWVTYLLWKLLLLGIVASGVYQQYLEAQELKQQQPDKDWKQEKMETFYYYKQYFTQDFTWTKDSIQEALMELVEYQAVTPVGRIFGASIVLWILVMTATTTARTAKFLIPKPKPKPVLPPIVDMAEAIYQRKYALCTVASTNADIYIRKAYPDAKRILKDTPEEAFAALLKPTKEECQLVVTVVDAWKEYQYNLDINDPEISGSALQQMGDVVEHFDAGFALKADTEQFCTSLVQSTLDIHLTNMLQDGFMEQLWNDHLPTPPPVEGEEGTCVYDSGNGTYVCNANATDDPAASLVAPTDDAAAYYVNSLAAAEQAAKEATLSKSGRPFWLRILLFVISPLSWWRLFKWCFRTFWSFVFKCIMTMVVLGLAGAFSYGIMIMQVMADNYMDRKIIEDESESVASRGRSRTPRPVHPRGNNIVI